LSFLNPLTPYRSELAGHYFRPDPPLGLHPSALAAVLRASTVSDTGSPHGVRPRAVIPVVRNAALGKAEAKPSRGPHHQVRPESPPSGVYSEGGPTAESERFRFGSRCLSTPGLSPLQGMSTLHLGRNLRSASPHEVSCTGKASTAPSSGVHVAKRLARLQEPCDPSWGSLAF